MGEKLKEWWSKYEIPKSWLEVEWDVPNMDFEKGKERMIICSDCDSYRKSVRLCNECNCFMPVKVLFHKQECPLGKW